MAVAAVAVVVEVTVVVYLVMILKAYCWRQGKGWVVAVAAVVPLMLSPAEQ